MSTITLILVLLLGGILFQLVRIFELLERQQKRADAKEYERQNRRDHAKQALKAAVRDLSNERFKGMDYTFGTGHGYRRAKRIVEAKTLDDVDRIISGEDVATELDDMHFWEAVNERDNDGKLFADLLPKWKRVELGLADQKEAGETNSDGSPESGTEEKK